MDCLRQYVPTCLTILDLQSVNGFTLAAPRLE
jgi:hypothetical protein